MVFLIKYQLYLLWNFSKVLEKILTEIYETLGKNNTDKSLWIINIDLLFSMYSQDNCVSFSNWYFVDSRIASKVKSIMHFLQLVHPMCSHHLTIFLWWSACYFSYILFQLFKCCNKQYLKQYIEKIFTQWFQEQLWCKFLLYYFVQAVVVLPFYA